VQIPFQIKLKDRSTVTNLLDKELLKYVIKKSKKRSEEEEEKWKSIRRRRVKRSKS
jgi:hypothetical protein